MTQKHIIYNAILKTIKEYGQDMETGAIRAALAELEGEIARKVSHQNFSLISDQVKEAPLGIPHEHK